MKVSAIPTILHFKGTLIPWTYSLPGIVMLPKSNLAGLSNFKKWVFCE